MLFRLSYPAEGARPRGDTEPSGELYQGAYADQPGARVRSVLPLLALVAVAVGCGDDAVGTTTLAEWRAEADGVCADNDEALTAIGTPDFDLDSDDLDTGELNEAAEYLGEVTALQQATIDALERIPPPEERATDVDDLLGTVQQGIDDLGRAAEAARAGDVDEYRQFLASGREENGDAAQASGELGLRDCGRPDR